jgi:IS605 OrfB family transposase
MSTITTTVGATEELASFLAALRFEHLPRAVVDRTEDLFLDWIASALAGRNAPPVRILARFAATMGPSDGPSQILVSRRHTSPLFAALVNGAASHVVEQDDVHNGAVFHPGTVVFPAVLATAQHTGATGRDTIVAAAVGYEAGVRIGAFLGRSHYRVFHTTGTAGTLAAAAGAAHVLGADTPTMLHTLGSAGTQAAGLWEFLRDAADSKQLHTAKAAADGLLAAYLAHDGFTGAKQILEGVQGMAAGMSTDADPRKLAIGLGQRWTILETSFKFHASCRHTHPAADALRMCGVCVNSFQQKLQLKDIRAELPEYAAIHSHVLQDVLARLDKAFQAFFRRVKAGQEPGYPRFHGRNRYHSFTYFEFGNGARLDNGFLVLSKIGRIAVRWSRPIAGKPKTVTMSREADGWYCCFSCQDVPMQALPPTGQETGIDLGLESFLTTADGTQVENPRHYRQAQAALRRAQRRVSRRRRGSHRRRKAVALLARKHQKVQRKRRDHHHKTALALVRQYDTIYFEDLQAANMVQNHHLAKSISDAGWAQFCSILSFKAVCAGKKAVAVPPAYTSQACSGCGVIVRKGVSVRWHSCPECGAELHRDHNAALNIQMGGSSVGRGSPVRR